MADSRQAGTYVVIGVVAFLVIYSLTMLILGVKPIDGRKTSKLSNYEELLVEKAKEIYAAKKQAGFDLVNGPCLSDDFEPGWVVDIAHNPRLPIDDLSENQCPSYRSGQAGHFIELDPEGSLIRMK